MKLKDKTSRRQFLASGLGAFLLPTIQRHNAVPSGVASLSPIRYRNVADSAGLHFVLENHPTPQKHLIESMAGGVAAFDYNNDGLTDIYFTNGASIPSLAKDSSKYFNRLYRNDGGMKFTDVTEEAGVAGAGYSMGGAAGDYDNDGYVNPFAARVGKGMSVAFADYDGDGFTDVFVSNDSVPNFLFHNRGDGTFEEVALPAGVGLTDDGRPVSSMGVDFRDYDNDGLPDLIVTALARETFPLFRNEGKGFFRDSTFPSRIGLASAGRSGWGVGLVDLNNDGWKDVFSANSHVTDNIEKFSVDRYQQPNRVFANLGNGTFEDVSAAAGPDFQAPRAHRGAAFADFNHDGKVDVVVSSLGGPAEL